MFIAFFISFFVTLWFIIKYLTWWEYLHTTVIAVGVTLTVYFAAMAFNWGG